MYVMTAVNVPQNVVRVYDTSDNTNEVIRLDTAVQAVHSGKLRISGLSSMGKYKDSKYLPSLNIYVSFFEARESMAQQYIKSGMNPEAAYRKVGLCR